MEAHGTTLDARYDKVKQTLRLETDRPHALREAILACRKGGTVSIPGVYGGFLDKMPMGAAMNKGLTFKMGQTHMQRYMQPLLERIQNGEIDPARVITHRLGIDDAPGATRPSGTRRTNASRSCSSRTSTGTAIAITTVTTLGGTGQTGGTERSTTHEGAGP